MSRHANIMQHDTLPNCVYEPCAFISLVRCTTNKQQSLGIGRQRNGMATHVAALLVLIDVDGFVIAGTGEKARIVTECNTHGKAAMISHGLYRRVMSQIPDNKHAIHTRCDGIPWIGGVLRKAQYGSMVPMWLGILWCRRLQHTDDITCGQVSDHDALISASSGNACACNTRVRHRHNGEDIAQMQIIQRPFQFVGGKLRCRLCCVLGQRLEGRVGTGP